MANEHVLIFETEPPIPFTVANGTGIERGTLVRNTDPMTAIAVSSTKQAVAGVTSQEKIASDGITKVGVYFRGIFRAIGSGTITVGDGLVTDHTGNKIVSASALTSLSGRVILGTALETSTDGESLLYHLNPQYINMGSAGGTG